jgi:hypothetical protein
MHAVAPMKMGRHRCALLSMMAGYLFTVSPAAHSPRCSMRCASAVCGLSVSSRRGTRRSAPGGLKSGARLSVSCQRPGYGGPATGFEAIKRRLAELG